MTGLRLAPDLTLPINAAIARYVLIGKSGAGKTNSDRVLIEEFVRAGVPTMVVDPLGNMRGLRSSADGEGAGLPMAIFGGSHGDVPLPFDKVIYIADLLAEGVSAVLDLSQMDLEESVEFTKRLISRFEKRVQGNAHVVFEEADRFTPNAVGHKNPINTFARTARNAGIGWTFSTQRPQILSRAVIDSASVFIAMRMTGSLAQDAIGGEIGSRIGKAMAKAMIADLPNFARGEAWFIPEADFLGDEEPEMEPVRFRFRLCETFDVRPPKVGQIRREPKVLADVDLEHLREALAIEDDLDDDADVDELRTRVAALEKELAETRDILAKKNAEPVGLTPDQEALVRNAIDAIQAVDAAYDRLRETIAPLGEVLAIAQRFKPHVVPVQDVERRTEPSARLSGRTVSASRPAESSHKPGNASLAGGPMRMLDALAGYRDGRATRIQLGALSGYVASGGAFRNNLSALRTAGYIIDDGKTVVLTDAGRVTAGAQPAVTTRAVIELWRSKLDGGPRKMLDALLAVYPNGMTRAQLAASTSYEQSGGAFRNYLSSLRTKDLIDERGGQIFAARELYPTGAPR